MRVKGTNSRVVVIRSEEWDPLFTEFSPVRCLMCGGTESTERNGGLYVSGFTGAHVKCMEIYVVLKALKEIA